MMKHALSVAPMMHVTDVHFRYLFRLLSRSTVLYTEMVLSDQLLRIGPDRMISLQSSNFAPKSTILQLGGSCSITMGRAAAIARQHGGYEQFNINCGCPSRAVAGTYSGGGGGFGAALMRDPLKVGG